MRDKGWGAAATMTLAPTSGSSSTLVDLVDRILDKGLVINADIVVSVAGVELLGIKIRAALASFETAATFGLQFPSGTNYHAEGWRRLEMKKEECPNCREIVHSKELLEEGCPKCGWLIAVKARRKRKAGEWKEEEEEEER